MKLRLLHCMLQITSFIIASWIIFNKSIDNIDNIDMNIMYLLLFLIGIRITKRIFHITFITESVKKISFIRPFLDICIDSLVIFSELRNINYNIIIIILYIIYLSFTR